jgi:hypothetical protein
MGVVDGGYNLDNVSQVDYVEGGLVHELLNQNFSKAISSAISAALSGPGDKR